MFHTRADQLPGNGRELQHLLEQTFRRRVLEKYHGNVTHSAKDITGDNPIIWLEKDDGLMFSGCHCDASHVGLEMDYAGIAATMITRPGFVMICCGLILIPWTHSRDQDVIDLERLGND